MSNVKPGDLAWYTRSQRFGVGPFYGQFCKVLGPVKDSYKLNGCCGNHVLEMVAMPDTQYWEVEWASPVVVERSSAGQELTMIIGPVRDDCLKKIDGGITEKDIDKEIELDSQSGRTAPVEAERTGLISDIKVEFSFMQGLALVAQAAWLVVIGWLRAVDRFFLGPDPLAPRARGAKPRVRVEPRVGGL